MIHVDDICFGGDEEFLWYIIGRMKEKLKIGEEKEDDFRYLGMRIKNEAGRIRLDQQEYLEMVIPEKTKFKGERLNRKGNDPL